MPSELLLDSEHSMVVTTVYGMLLELSVGDIKRRGAQNNSEATNQTPD